MVATGSGTVQPLEVKEDLKQIAETLQKLGEKGADLGLA